MTVLCKPGAGLTIDANAIYLHKRRGGGCRSCVIGPRINSRVSHMFLAFCSRFARVLLPFIGWKHMGFLLRPNVARPLSPSIARKGKSVRKKKSGGATSAWDADFDWKWKRGGATSLPNFSLDRKRKRCGVTSLQQFSYGALLEIQHNVI